MITLYQLICDYGVGDGAFAEVVQRFHALDPGAKVNVLSVPEFSTLATGFWIAQLGLWNPVANTVIFSNTAPRHDDHAPRDKNEGEKFVYVELDNGMKIGTVNSGYALSFVKERIVKFHKIVTEENGSQFRSRDYYPRALVETLNGERELGEELDVDSIPEVPENRIVYIDGYGNIKTSIRNKELKIKNNSKVNIEINGIERGAVCGNGIFEVKSGDLVLAPGSSGDPEDPFLEIVLRRGSSKDPSAGDIFGASVEDEIVITLKV